MSRVIDFKYPCPACKHVSPQSARKPTLITPTVGWLKCPECECELQVQLTFDTNHRQTDGRPQLRISTMKIRQSKKHHERIMAQRERLAKEATAIKQEVNDVGFKIIPPEGAPGGGTLDSKSGGEGSTPSVPATQAP